MLRAVTDVKPVPRRERAARTRRAIVAAATEEFRTAGYHGTTMAAIARRAGVAVQTVYFVFHTKPALLTAAIDHAVMGDDALPPDQTLWWQEATTTADGTRALTVFVSEVTVINARAAALDRVADAAATTDPELGAVVAHHAALRMAGFRAYVDTLAARGLLKGGLDSGEATDVLLTLVGSHVFYDFTEGRGWPVERYVAWTVDVLGATLLAGDAVRRS